jgi:hypothetical protein
LDFFNTISKRPTEILPIPKPSRRKVTTSEVDAPRQSRRVAEVGVEFSMQDWGSRSIKKAMKTLVIIKDSCGISHEALDEYVKLFKHPISPNPGVGPGGSFWLVLSSSFRDSIELYLSSLVVRLLCFLWILQNF